MQLRRLKSGDDPGVEPAALPLPSGEIVPYHAEPPNLSDDVRLQKLWLALQRRPWRSLAVLAASPSIGDPIDTLWVAELIAKLVWWYRGDPSTVFDLRDLTLRLVDYQLQVVAAQATQQTCAIMALRSTFENPTAIPLAHSVHAAVLCVELGKTDLKAAQQTIAEVGADRVLGSIVLRRGHGKRSSRRR
jgi:hypothetical protein